MSGTVIVTGVSRRVGIAYAIADRLCAEGWRASLSAT